MSKLLENGEDRSSRPGFDDFYKARAPHAMWLSRALTYRFGALLALPLSRLGVSPNVISLLSFLVAVLGAVAAVNLGYGEATAAIVLFITGHLGYALDAADGLVARVTGKGSSFGAILDKSMDTVVAVAVPTLLTAGVFAGSEEPVPVFLLMGSLALLLAARLGLAVSMWLREAIEKRERTAVDGRARTPVFYIKQFVGNVVLDDVSFRTLLALAWWQACFPELLAVLAFLLTLMMMVYMVGTKRAMDFQDRLSAQEST